MYQTPQSMYVSGVRMTSVTYRQNLSSSTEFSAPYVANNAINISSSPRQYVVYFTSSFFFLLSLSLSPLRLLHLFCFFLIVQDGYTPLHLAADRGKKVIVQLLLDNDADFMAIEKVRELGPTLRICINKHLHS
jgi:ankyrin repeat protein